MNKLAARMSKLTKVVEKVVQVIAIALLVILICAIFFQVARRILTGKSIIEIEEFSIVLASWCAFLTVSYAAHKRVHVKIEVFTEKLPFYLRHILSLVIQVVIFAACVSLTFYGWKLADKKMMVPMTVLPIHSGWWYASFPVGMAFTSFFVLDEIIQQIAVLTNGPQAETPPEAQQEV